MGRHHALHPARCVFAVTGLSAVLEVGKIPLEERAGRSPESSGL